MGTRLDLAFLLDVAGENVTQAKLASRAMVYDHFVLHAVRADFVCTLSAAGEPPSSLAKVVASIFLSLRLKSSPKLAKRIIEVPGLVASVTLDDDSRRSVE